MSQINWFQAIIDILQAIISGIVVAFVIYWLDERRTERDRNLSDYRIASNWDVSKPKVSMRNFQLSNQNLSGCDFSTANLENVNLSKAWLHGVNFSKANLRHANFQTANLLGTQFDGAIAYNVNFSGAQIGREIDALEKIPIDFSRSNLFGSSFWKAKIHQTVFTKTNLSNTDFTGAIVEKCDFTGADLTGSKWKKVKRVENCKWKDVIVDDQGNFPRHLWEEIQQQNGKSSRKHNAK